ncbi:hypothetical protein COO60DRAFT_139853 [Scenedesmus sp. NREL 46B-D3]|nr:hypothetical protein COO60DRAFT_139853 [Scenedesmus sp. NREL 46B-D3]
MADDAAPAAAPAAAAAQTSAGLYSRHTVAGAAATAAAGPERTRAQEANEDNWKEFFDSNVSRCLWWSAAGAVCTQAGPTPQLQLPLAWLRQQPQMQFSSSSSSSGGLSMSIHLLLDAYQLRQSTACACTFPSKAGAQSGLRCACCNIGMACASMCSAWLSAKQQQRRLSTCRRVFCTAHCPGTSAGTGFASPLRQHWIHMQHCSTQSPSGRCLACRLKPGGVLHCLPAWARGFP